MTHDEEVLGYKADPSLLRSSDGINELLEQLRQSECGVFMETPVSLFRFMGAQQVVMTIDMKNGRICLPGEMQQSERVRQFIDCVNQMTPILGIRRENEHLKDLLERALKRGISPQDPLRLEILEALK